MKKILVIESDPNEARRLSETLSRAGYKVVTQADAQKGMASALDSELSLIIASVELPDENGFVLCSKIKHHPQTARIPLILISNSDSTSAFVQHAALPEHADGYFLKPIDYDILLQEIAEQFTYINSNMP